MTTGPAESARRAGTVGSVGPAGPAGPTESGAPDVAELVAAAAVTVPGVAALNGGMFGEVATYLPGRRVSGVREDADVVEVHVTLDWGADVPTVAGLLQRVVRQVPGVGDRRVEIFVEDVSERERA